MQYKNNDFKIPIISFFTGGGFLDMGFEKAGFEITYTNENDKDFAKFYSEGMSNWAGKNREISSTDSITNISNNEIKSQIKSDLFGVIGGPPCQDFSIRGSKAGFEGIRGTLTFHFYEKIMDLKPTFFLMENVPGLVLLNKTKKHFYSLLDLFREEYFISDKALNSLHYGVPQSRERLFIFGIRKAFINNHELNSLNNSWFPWPIPLYPNAETSFNWSEPKSRYKKNDLPTPPTELCVISVIEEQDESGSNNIPNMNEYFNLRKPEKIKKIEEGDTYRPSFKKLHRNKYSPTACYGNNEVHLHPYLNRRISVRESLRIQGVSDNYIINSPGKLSKKFKMIGNGVPVPLAYHIASSIKDFIISNFLDKEKLNGYLVKGEKK
ncbi:MAG: DNA cytosine methyltransferase [Candidatus Paceibacterota bacterium]